MDFRKWFVREVEVRIIHLLKILSAINLPICGMCVVTFIGIQGCLYKDLPSARELDFGITFKVSQRLSVQGQKLAYSAVIEANNNFIKKLRLQIENEKKKGK